MATHHTTTAADEALLAKYLHEALGKEQQLVTALQAQIAVAKRPGVEHALVQHLEVTRRQVNALQLRLDDLDDGTGLIPNPIDAVVGLATSVANKGLALAKGPLVALRGTSASDRELRMVRDCYWNEAEEIAHYRVIETVAEQVGDEQTAELARRHRAEEEQMQTTLEGHLPAVVRAVVAEETPARSAA
ncbi:MAG: DUF892 family protein [Solirubrobacteraceae bacterium]|nr:DUF892 family protein [Solirubrobacteraceae bacterium]